MLRKSTRSALCNYALSLVLMYDFVLIMCFLSRCAVYGLRSSAALLGMLNFDGASKRSKPNLKVRNGSSFDVTSSRLHANRTRCRDRI